MTTSSNNGTVIFSHFDRIRYQPTERMEQDEQKMSIVLIYIILDSATTYTHMLEYQKQKTIFKQKGNEEHQVQCHFKPFENVCVLCFQFLHYYNNIISILFQPFDVTFLSLVQM